MVPVENISQIQCGHMSSYCLDWAGRLFTFGCNFECQLGRINSEILIDSLGECFESVTAGHSHVCCISVNSKIIYAFGSNSWSKCGVVTEYGRYRYIRSPSEVNFDFNGLIESVKCGGSCNVVKVRRNSGELYEYYAFGCNQFNACLLFCGRKMISTPTRIPLDKVKQQIQSNSIVDIVPTASETLVVTCD